MSALPAPRLPVALSPFPDTYAAHCPACRCVVALALVPGSLAVAPIWAGDCPGCRRRVRLSTSKDGGGKEERR